LAGAPSVKADFGSSPPGRILWHVLTKTPSPGPSGPSMKRWKSSALMSFLHSHRQLILPLGEVGRNAWL